MTKHTSSCHCGGLKIEFDMAAGEQAITCNCSICRRKGSMLVFRTSDKVAVQKTTETKDYQFGKKTIHHFFCKECGVSPWSEAEHNGAKTYAINLHCVDGLDEKSVTVNQYDGAAL
ncbi:MAG: GFA family protein [Hydrotalea sp.]|nr:GFA family protein [Hydrotalea sp.]